ncbi:hypothetical protein K523DRAFT_421890 [Schizophyllum commune Tattone D]|nr:hypothetical protein K523DRAFT_421890 [Schizophyllum commune Tattone D]
MQMIFGAQPGAMQHQHASWIEDYEKEIIDGPPVDESIYNEPPPRPDAAYTLMMRDEEKSRSQSPGVSRPEQRRRPIKKLPDSSVNLKRAQDQLAQPPPVHATSSIAPRTARAIVPHVPVAHPPAAPIALPPPPPIVLPPISAFAPQVAAPIATTAPLAVCTQPTPITRSFMREFGILRVGQGTRFDDHSEELQIDNHRPSGMVALLKDRVLEALRL